MEVRSVLEASVVLGLQHKSDPDQKIVQVILLILMDSYFRGPQLEHHSRTVAEDTVASLTLQ